MIESINGKTPLVDPSAFIAPGAVVLGDVELGPEVSVWYGCVLRGDINWIRVGARTNLQDGSVIHVSHTGQGTLVGCEVVVGHRVVLHSCTVEDQVLIGMGAVVLDRAQVGQGAIVAAGAVVPPGMIVPPDTMVAGVPAKVIRPVTPEQRQATVATMERYLKAMAMHKHMDTGEGRQA
ncbi:MAG: gamma carbonic anhydrase family protein [Desulfarculaceae bacterium]|nr:gamma carbonic anhydrase family protein [Desulfarculaceae bacterium]MCF8047262.1 gamma carbonic anhydrase family protein [Desulfarculaceae bacterium]MCF8066736.1 gamma carbonic anhydrase family protein [Desulfarculaceae bacterium]MCF8097793.1 gamma carbonic anhydrase family protein [Desulfarculaceae bacterium]MCF8122350.1 gamma carbonic anhydrase family protein [Desulfarculaceae bacterium]